jgi:hypothetical protein
MAKFIIKRSLAVQVGGAGFALRSSFPLPERTDLGDLVIVDVDVRYTND